MPDLLLQKRRLGRVWRRFHGPATPRGIVLLYHAIGSESRNALAVSAFEAQMTYLHQHARVLPLDELLEGGWRRAGIALACAITFDDGYAGVFRAAYPVLRNYGFPATVYLTTDAIGASACRAAADHPGLLAGEPMLTWSEVREMSADKIAAGSHLCRHADLTLLPAAEARRELTSSKQVIEDRLGRPCAHFAYPWGRYNLRAAEWVAASGYRAAVMGIHRPIPETIDHWRIPRLDVRREYTLEDFQAVVSGDWDYLGAYQTLRRWLRP